MRMKVVLVHYKFLNESFVTRLGEIEMMRWTNKNAIQCYFEWRFVVLCVSINENQTID